MIPFNTIGPNFVLITNFILTLTLILLLRGNKQSDIV
jgi:hypothetical protein